MITPNPFVSVIIPTYHDWDRLKLCINGLLDQKYPISHFEVIIVNNDPEDTPKNLPLPDNFSFVSESSPGSYAARNTGITIAKGEIFAFIDSDCIPAPDWLKNGVHEITRGNDRVAGKVELYYKSDKLTIAEIYEKVFAFPQENYVKNENSSITANLITTANAFKTVGLFDSSLLSGGDMEWGWRARDKGLTIAYSPQTVVFHPARSTIREIIQKNQRVIEGLSCISNLEENKKRWFIYALASPIERFVSIKKRNDISGRMKLFASMISYLFELHKCGYWMAIKTGIVTPTKE